MNVKNSFQNISIFVLFTISINISLYSQNGLIKGILKDTTNDALSLASVMLLDPLDSTLIEYTQADDNGQFEFNSVPFRKYLLKANYVSYIPLQIPIQLNTKILDLGTLKMYSISKELFEIVIKAAKAPMVIKGDTIEYDASTFKVPIGSSVEDLLRKLPGMEVDAQGNITSEGKSVNRVTVDGKNFFGGDPKAATKNLPAEGISKVQVFTDQTEEEKITGRKRLNADRAMNLELKDEFKKGGFGKIIAGIGLENTKELKGSYNKFNTKHQFAIVGSGTNTGRNGLSWNDYQDFKGSNSFNWGDDGEFGFAGGGGNFRMVIFDDGGEDEDISGVGSFFGGDTYGFPQKINGGLNYNFDHKKTKLSSMYFLESNNLYSDAYRTQNLLYPDNPYNTRDTSSRDNKRLSHRVELRFEQEIDSFMGFIIKSNSSLGNRTTVTQTNTHSYDPYNLTINDQLADVNVKGTTINSQNSIIFRSKFKKKGRNMGISAAFNMNNTDRNSDQEANSNFYASSGSIDSISRLNQNFVTDQFTNTYKANFFWMEPIGKKIFSRSFYNFNKSLTEYDRNVGDFKDSVLVNNNFLSREFNNTTGYNRLGQGFSYINKGFSVNLGLAYQEIYLKSNFKTDLDTFLTNSYNVYQNWIPNGEIEYEMSNGTEFSLSYSKFASPPNSKDLLPIIDNSNPLSIRIGNPDLEPKVTNDMSISFRRFNRLTFINLSSRLSYIYNEKDIIYVVNISPSRVSTSMPINVDGTKSLNANLNFGFPIVKNKYTINLNYNYNYFFNITNVNMIINNPLTHSHNAGIRVNITPVDMFTLFIGANYRIQQQKADQNSSETTNIYGFGTNADLNIKFPKLFFFNTSFNLNNNSNSINNFNTTIPILNFSISKLFLKENKGEVRISAYDVFNKTQGIQQFVSANRISQNQTLSLARYILLSFTYNMRGLKSNLEKGGRRGMMMF